MQIHVSGKGIDVGEALRTHIEQRLEQVVTKYIDRVTSASAVISKESHLFRIDINGNLGTHAGLVVKSTATGVDVYAACDAALDKIEKQLRRYKRKISNHHKLSHGGAEAAFMPGKAKKYILSPDAGEHEDALPKGVVIAEKAAEIGTMTVSEAVMQMDLQDLPALMFYNASHGGLNVVYRRADGNISWLDPEAQKAA
jgi:ribosomal subunit interface protein